MNTPTKPHFRANDEINNMSEIEFCLQPTSSTMREYRRQGAASRCATAYRGELERGNFWPMLWSSQFDDNCAEESRVSMNLCQSTVPQDLSIFPNKIIQYSREDFSTTTRPAAFKSKSADLFCCLLCYLIFSMRTHNSIRSVHPSVGPSDSTSRKGNAHVRPAVH